MPQDNGREPILELRWPRWTARTSFPRCATSYPALAPVSGSGPFFLLKVIPPTPDELHLAEGDFGKVRGHGFTVPRTMYFKAIVAHPYLRSDGRTGCLQPTPRSTSAHGPGCHSYDRGRCRSTRTSGARQKK